MDILQIIQYVIATVVVPFGVYVVREISMVKERLADKMSNAEVEKLIDLKQQVLDVRQQELKDDLTRIENKIDRLLDKLTQ